MEGYYATATSSAGKNSLRIFGELQAPAKLEFGDAHYAVFVMGDKK
jgi:hypothetical protein